MALLLLTTGGLRAKTERFTKIFLRQRVTQKERGLLSCCATDPVAALVPWSSQSQWAGMAGDRVEGRGRQWNLVGMDQTASWVIVSTQVSSVTFQKYVGRQQGGRSPGELGPGGKPETFGL